jgi:hypothetical protein
LATNNLAYNNFIRNISSIDDLNSIYQNVITNIPEFKDQASEILRASIVLSISALDNYMHEFYRNEIVEGYLGVGNFEIKFDSLLISIQGMRQLDAAPSLDAKRNYLIQEMRKIQKTDSYQSPKSIEYIFNNLNIKNIWTQLETIGIQGLSASDIKSELSNIIDRRNKISHESDWDLINEKKFPIDLGMSISTVNFIKSLVYGINNIS